MSRHRIALFGGTLAFYLAIVWAVLITSWLVALDWKVMLFRPYQQWPELHPFLDYYVVLGQRGPHGGDGRLLAGLALLASAHAPAAAGPRHVPAAAQCDGGRGQAGARAARPALRDADRLGRDVRRRRYISFRAHRERRRDLGNPRLPGHHATSQALSVGSLRDGLAGRRPHHRLHRYALAQRCPAGVGGRSAHPAGAPLVRAADRPDRGLDLRDARAVAGASRRGPSGARGRRRTAAGAAAAVDGHRRPHRRGRHRPGRTGAPRRARGDGRPGAGPHRAPGAPGLHAGGPGGSSAGRRRTPSGARARAARPAR